MSKAVVSMVTILKVNCLHKIRAIWEFEHIITESGDNCIYIYICIYKVVI